MRHQDGPRRAVFHRETRRISTSCRFLAYHPVAAELMGSAMGVQLEGMNGEEGVRAWADGGVQARVAGHALRRRGGWPGAASAAHWRANVGVTGDGWRQ